MYDKAAVGGGLASIAALPVTGFGLVWYLIAGFALLTAGGALLRIAPRRKAS